MNRIVALMLVLGISLAVIASGRAAEVDFEQAKAVAEIRRLHGRVTVDEKSPDKPVIGVSLASPMVTDVALEHLQCLTQLQSLKLAHTHVTDVGLAHLKGLTKLLELYLTGTQVTDAGVEKLQQALPRCRIKH
jgi:hypothetical protein